MTGSAAGAGAAQRWWPHRAGRLLVAAAAGLLVTVLALLGTAEPAAAHAYPIASSPGGGATVRTALSSVSVTFSEVVHRSFAVLAVTGPAGQRLDTGPPRVLDTTVRQDVAPLPAAGTYTLSYRVVSADGHPVTGTLRFRFVPPAGYRPAVSHRAVNSGRTSRPGGSPAGGHGRDLLVLVGVLLAGTAALLFDRRRRPRPD